MNKKKLIEENKVSAFVHYEMKRTAECTMKKVFFLLFCCVADYNKLMLSVYDTVYIYISRIHVINNFYFTEMTTIRTIHKVIVPRERGDVVFFT